MMDKETQYKIKQVTLDGKEIWKFKCPRCGTWGYIDDDQLHGRISTQCQTFECTFHRTIDFDKVCCNGGG